MSGIIVAKNNLIVPRPPEFKAVAFQVKAVDDQRGIIEGILNATGNIDDGHDRTFLGAFKKTLNDSYSRKSAQHLEYLWPYLWNHDPNEPPIGGIFDAEEVKAKGDTPAGLYTKTQLILDIERARDVYACFKSQAESNTGSSGLLKQSMGYKAIRYEYVNEKVDGQTLSVRNLLEVQIWEGSAVVFPMNDLSVVTTVKSGNDRPDKRYFFMNGLEDKTVIGSTSGPIGPRDEGWSGSAAEKWIWSKALDEEDNVKPAVARKYFLKLDGDPKLKGSYGYPFWVNDHICVGGVKACANALSGARNADAGSDEAGMKKKVETLYGRINSKYPEADKLVPPWKDDGKSGADLPEKKDFNTLYMAAQAADALEDWSDLVDTLTKAMMQAFAMGDQPVEDMRDALSQFGEATMKWVDTAMECCMDDYLSDRYGYNNETPYVPYSMRVGGYDAMSRQDRPEGKTGARFSEDTKKTLQQHADDLKAMAAEHKTRSDELAAQYKTAMKGMRDHADALEKKASDLTELWHNEGQGPAYADDPDHTKDDKSSATRAAQKSRREPLHSALTRTSNHQPGTPTEDEELKALEAALAQTWKKR